MKYEKTKDPNIIKQTEEVVSEIHLNKLEKQILDLQTEIDNLPKLIVCPGDVNDEIKELVEEYNIKIPDKIRLEKQLQDKKDLLVMLKGL